MELTGTTVKIVAILCLLLFQVQLYASAALGCRHIAEAVADASADGCRFHQGVAGDDGTGSSDRVFDCHKCALYLAVGGAFQVASPVLLSALPIRSATEPSLERHFYRFIPDSFSRPPIEPVA